MKNSERVLTKMKRASLSILVAVLMLLVAAWVVAGQTKSITQLVQPLVVTFQQDMPAEVIISVFNTDDELITKTIPVVLKLDAQIELRESEGLLEDDSQKPITFELEDAESLLATLEDMPNGFYLDGSGSSSDNASLSEQFVDSDAMLEELTEMGRQGGMWNQYRNSSFSLFGGQNALIGSTALVFDTTDGAEKYLMSAIYRETERNDPPLSVSQLSAPQIGDSSIAFKTDGKNEDTEFTAYSFWSRIGNAILIVDARSLRDAGKFEDVVSLAEKLVQRAQGYE